MQSIDIALRNGHRKLAAYFVKKEADKDNLSSYGMNFLHKEVLSFPFSKESAFLEVLHSSLFLI